MADEIENMEPAEHLDICQCELCVPADYRPLPPELPECEALLNEREFDALLADAGLDRRSISVEPIKVGDEFVWSEIEVRHAMEDAAWRSRHSR